MKVYEAGRTEKSGRPVRYERIKQVEYEARGILYYFLPVKEGRSMANFYHLGTLPESLDMLSDVLSLGLGLKLLHDPGLFPTDQPRWFHEVP